MKQKTTSLQQENLKEMLGVMIVDDDPICHFVAKGIAERSGRVGQIQQAWNGNDALQQLTNALSLKLQLPGIILLDINMPTMDGFEFLTVFQQLKRQMKNPPRVVVLSSSILVDDQQKAKMLGADHVMEKPLTYSLFSDILKTCSRVNEAIMSDGR